MDLTQNLVELLVLRIENAVDLLCSVVPGSIHLYAKFVDVLDHLLQSIVKLLPGIAYLNYCMNFLRPRNHQSKLILSIT